LGKGGTAVERAGRLCPTDYRYTPAVFDRAPELTAEALYVVGGLYGNLAAVDEIEHLSAVEAATIAHRPLYGIVRAGVHIDAIPVYYDHDTFLARFLRRWPAGAAAHASYFSRIMAGPDHSVERAAPAEATP
jgi:hypothetical protein